MKGGACYRRVLRLLTWMSELPYLVSRPIPLYLSTRCLARSSSTCVPGAGHDRFVEDGKLAMEAMLQISESTASTACGSVREGEASPGASSNHCSSPHHHQHSSSSCCGSEGDTVREYLCEAFGRMCRVMGIDFIVYLPRILPPLLQALTVKPKEMRAEEAEDDEVRPVCSSPCHHASCVSALFSLSSSFRALGAYFLALTPSTGQQLGSALYRGVCTFRDMSEAIHVQACLCVRICLPCTCREAMDVVGCTGLRCRKSLYVYVHIDGFICGEYGLSASPVPEPQ